MTWVVLFLLYLDLGTAVLRRQTSAPAHFIDDALYVLDEMYTRYSCFLFFSL